MSNIDSLANAFMKFPGIGTRQAKRFVYFLLAQDPYYVDMLAREIAELKKSIVQCTACLRFYPRKGAGESADSRLGRGLCSVCVDDADSSTLMVVEKDTDFDSVRRSGSYAGRYFILGGTIPVLERDPASKITRLLGWAPQVTFEAGVAKMLEDINYWNDAPAWTPETIEKATEDWFKYLVKD